MILQIPLKAVPNQSFNVILDNQQCTIKLYARNVAESETENIQPLIVNQPLFSTELCVNGLDPLDWLLVNNSDPLTVAESENIYMDLYVSGVLVFQGMVCLYGSYINQYKSPLFNGYLFMDTIDKIDPEWPTFGTTTTLNWTDNGTAS